MANYVMNKVICSKEILDNYFIDYYPFGTNDERMKEPYITFNKIAGVKTLNEYREKFKKDIDYSWGVEYIQREDGKWEIKFFTRWLYPIYAIVKSIEKFKNDIEWYAVEEDMIYLSKFICENDNVVEYTLYLENTDYENYYEKCVDSDIEYDAPDSDIWHFDFESKKDWIVWKSDDLINRYLKDYPAKKYYTEIRNCNTYNDIKKEKADDINQKFKYIYVEYLDAIGDKMFCYTSVENFEPGDIVIVPRGFNDVEVYAKVITTKYYNSGEEPYPVNGLKEIYGKIDKNEIDMDKYKNDASVEYD